MAERRATGRTVLVVDDNRLGRELAHDVLAAAGYAVLEAEGVDDALGLVASASPDLVVLDWHLRGATGGAVLERLRADPTRPPTPVLVVTADARPEVAAAVMARGAVDVLTKPYRAAALVRAAERALGQRDGVGREEG
jgi:CheY-like chemotaxis protein